jgi:uncharacterized protein YcgI (DUF1989 family)
MIFPKLHKKEEFIIPKETGKAFVVKRDQILRIIEVDGPQTADVNIWNLYHYGEAFSAGRTRYFSGIHPKKGDSLWSAPPYDRKMFTIIEDTVEHIVGPWGEESHDILYPRCSPIVFRYPFGKSNVSSCYENLAKAIEPFGLKADQPHDTINFFMRTGIDKAGQIFIAQPEARKGDYVDLLAHMNSLVAISSCPAGGIHGTQDVNRPLKIEIYDQSDF